jgi:hypothetical protein
LHAGAALALTPSAKDRNEIAVMTLIVDLTGTFQIAGFEPPGFDCRLHLP